MSAHTILDTYFKSKDYQGHFENIKSIHDYAKKLEGQSNGNGTPKDIQFFDNGVTKKAVKGVKNALRIYQNAEKEKPDWPDDHTSLFFNSMIRAAERSGADSAAFKRAQKNYENKCIFYGKQLELFLKGLTSRKAKIAKHLTHSKNLTNYCGKLNKVFWKIAKIPSKITTGEQWHWVSLSEGALVLRGYASSCETVLKRMETTNSRAMKECKLLIKHNRMWTKWAKSRVPQESGNLKKNKKAKKPK